MKRRFLFGVLLILVMWFIEPFITGYWSGLSVQSTVLTGSVTPTDPTVMKINLSGTSAHSLMWSFTGGGTITVQVGVRTRQGGQVWATPTSTGPYTVVGGTPQIEPLFLPVCEMIKITFIPTGSTTGTLAFISS
jgi:hypothetical protein